MLKFLTKLNVAIALMAILLYMGMPDKVQIKEVPAGETRPAPGRVVPTGNNQYESIIRLVTPDGFFYCSGFVIDPHYALTAAHCVVNEIGRISDTDIMIHGSKGGKTGVVAKAIAIDTYRDVAMIFGNFKDFQIQSTDFYGVDVWYGMQMTSCGFPSGERKYCADLMHVGNYYFQFRTKGGPIYQGMSGGPVINSRTGNAIGVNSAVTEDSVIIGPLIGTLSILGF